MFKKKFIFLSILLLSIGFAFADDWEPTQYFNTKLEKLSAAGKQKVIQDGTYLSGTNDFAFYYLKDARVESGNILDTQDRVMISIVYKNTAYYFELNTYSNLNGQGLINYSVISTTPPVIIFYYSSETALQKLSIIYNGTDFLVNTLLCWPFEYPNNWNISKRKSTESFNRAMEMGYKYFYLQGERYINWDESHRVADDFQNYNPDKNHIYNFLGVEGYEYPYSDSYFQSYITDDNLRLRSSNSSSAKVIGHLSKGTLIRVINIDPNVRQMEGKNGFWVLVETLEKEVGWIWSGYINEFIYDFK